MNTMRNWRDQAVCLNEDPELFFPVGDCGPALVQIAAAKAVCARCPVVAQCLGFALAALPDGVAAGLTAEERRALRAQRHRRSRSPVSAARLPAGVDGQVVAELVAGERVSGASRQELAQAAIELRESNGRGCRWIAGWLGVADRQVYRWLERHRAGEPLTSGTGGGRGRVVVVGRG